jgi:hypothetical protein
MLDKDVRFVKHYACNGLSSESGSGRGIVKRRNFGRCRACSPREPPLCVSGRTNSSPVSAGQKTNKQNIEASSESNQGRFTPRYARRSTPLIEKKELFEQPEILRN